MNISIVILLHCNVPFVIPPAQVKMASFVANDAKMYYEPKDMWCGKRISDLSRCQLVSMILKMPASFCQDRLGTNIHRENKHSKKEIDVAFYI